MVFNLQSGHYFVIETATYKIQRGITQKIYIQELWFLRSAHHLMLINISVTFHEENIERFSSYRADGIVFCSRHSQSLRGTTQKNIYPKVMVLAICTLFNVGLYFYDFP